MAHLRKHWRLSALGAFAVLVSAGAMWWFNTARGAALVQEPPYSALSEVDHDAIDNLLERLRLDREALVGLNPTSQTAESIVANVRTWYETNSTTLATLQGNIDAKVVAIRRLEKKIRLGTADEGWETELATLRTDLKTARAAYETALAPLETTLNAAMTQAQRDTWAALQKGHGQHMPIRMLDLTHAQRLAVSKATHHYRRARSAASNTTERDAAHTAYESAIDGILTTDQKTAVSSYHTNYNTASASVASAFETVMVVDEG